MQGWKEKALLEDAKLIFFFSHTPQMTNRSAGHAQICLYKEWTRKKCIFLYL